MILAASAPSLAERIARTTLEGFDRHYARFRDCGRRARTAFEAADWHGSQALVRERIQFYDERVRETTEQIASEIGDAELPASLWRAVKLAYMGLLLEHKQPELAETFFNSVICKLLHRSYFHNEFIFFRPAISTELIEADPPTYTSYYADADGLLGMFERMLLAVGWQRPFRNLRADCQAILTAAAEHLGGRLPAPQPNFQLQVLNSPFYRNKAAYIVGKVINGHYEYPFALPILHDANGRLVVDTVLLETKHISQLFSLNRAYFLVDMEVPSAYVQFLRTIMPGKPKSEIYTMLGLQKQGKTMFYRDLIQHLRHSADNFIIAPGIRGLVMVVFTLPSFPYVFKVIKDKIAPPKEVDRETVKRKYLLVKQHDRVGRMADTLEFSNVALPRDRFSPELLAELKEVAPSVIDEEGDEIIIKHVYIERRMEPLNLYLDRVSPERAEAAIREYGNAIRELAAANIFPGDMLYKNFGVTRYDRVVFYDYDEIEYLTDCRFREIPPAPDFETEMSGEPWYSVAKNDVFPEEFGRFLLGNPRVRESFLKYHADLLRPEFWRERQERIRAGQLEDFFPYPHELRFCKRGIGAVST
ncbi:MAG: bifunctional isocitrate dehydrogenase kinase/phosphatase [Casimicrobiaceae bacterium]|nr:bifunctional isocitrate dehydrogenase kinase/phosphatase [Casimicrobiaceae bacterium]MCX8098787.1 bifunctional isocitrate dehydrogenase kinase/phosphatase [Casimicrobiaceae bacterium]MDW8313240.1 bifunctional isocitrate dehydrogenase kinase/phosphatase [Burkholderiales bacterium]